MSIADYIENTLKDQFSPLYLHVANESHGHNVPPNSETHFKVVMATEQFSGLAKVKRHQQVYAALSDALANGVHALALHLYTPGEWQAREAAPDSPPCLGGGS